MITVGVVEKAVVDLCRWRGVSTAGRDEHEETPHGGTVTR
jgi:hypothetical protein